MICPICGQEGGNGGKCLICGYAFSNASEGNNKISKLSICPVCGSELQTGISTCPICGAGIESNVEANVSDSIPEAESNIKAVNNSGNNKKILIAICLIAIIGVGGFFGYKFVLQKDDTTKESENISSEKDSADSNQEEASTDIEENVQSIDVSEITVDGSDTIEAVDLNWDAFTGYWNIKNDYNKELVIKSVDGETVKFSLYFDNAPKLENVSLDMQGNRVDFELTGGLSLEATLIFDDSSIGLKVIDSDSADIPIGYYVFEEKHAYSWKDGSENSNLSSASEYIIEDSDSRLLTEDELYYYSADELRIARNEIYARHGRLFDDQELQNYFDSKSWYYGTIAPADFSESYLSDIERKNANLMREVENQLRANL